MDASDAAARSGHEGAASAGSVVAAGAGGATPPTATPKAAGTAVLPVKTTFGGGNHTAASTAAVPGSALSAAGGLQSSIPSIPYAAVAGGKPAGVYVAGASTSATVATASTHTAASPSKTITDGKMKPPPVSGKASVLGVATAGGGSAATTMNKHSEGGVKSLKKGARKKRKTAVAAAAIGEVSSPTAAATTITTTVDDSAAHMKKRKGLKRPKKDDPSAGRALKKKQRPITGGGVAGAGATAAAVVTKKPTMGVVTVASYAEPGLSAAQIAVNEQMRRALEEDQYSAHGSIVESDSEDDEQKFVYKGNTVRLDRSFMLQTARKHNWMGSLYGPAASKQGSAKGSGVDDEEEEEEILQRSSSGVIEGVAGSDSPTKGHSGKKNSKVTRKTKGRAGGRKEDDISSGKEDSGASTRDATSGVSSSTDDNPMENERDEGSIFGQTTGASNSTWVECDKCKKWRRLRGVVDERKLPPKWYCSMNKNDPARARCSAPEEEYDAPQTAESAADSRTRKHLRVWVRRLQVNEQYEARQPTLTRGKKKSVTSSKEPFEWVRCCNPSCGKWRAVLRIMDAQQSVVDQTRDGEWYCVMNTWDEKTASCAAPQENLPAVGLPPWCLVDEN